MHICVAILLAIVWAAECLFVQHATCDSGHYHVPILIELRIVLKRFFINFLCAYCIITLCPRPLTLLFFVIDTFLSITLLVYFGYFMRPLSILAVIYQSGEGLEVWDSVLPLISTPTTLLFTVLLIAKSIILWRSTSI